MTERQAMLGQRIEIRQKFQRQQTNCAALRDRLRRLLMPAADMEELDRDAILDAASVLHGELGDLAVLGRKLSILNKELNG